MHICVGKLTTIGSDNGLSPEWHQGIIWTIAGILLIGPLGTNLSEILLGIQTFSFKKCIWKCSLQNGVHLSRPQCVKYTDQSVSRCSYRDCNTSWFKNASYINYLYSIFIHCKKICTILEQYMYIYESLHSIITYVMCIYTMVIILVDLPLSNM